MLKRSSFYGVLCMHHLVGTCWQLMWILLEVTGPLTVIDCAPAGLIYYLEVAGCWARKKKTDCRINCAERGNYLRLFTQNYIWQSPSQIPICVCFDIGSVSSLVRRSGCRTRWAHACFDGSVCSLRLERDVIKIRNRRWKSSPVCVLGGVREWSRAKTDRRREFMC